MKKLTTLILSFFPLLIWAHQDTYYTYKYGNVTVRFKTGFFFEEINNAKIIGKYAVLLSDELNYTKPILLDFIHDYGHAYKGKTYSFLNLGSEEYESVSYYEPKYNSNTSDTFFYPVPLADTTDYVFKGYKKEIDKVAPEDGSEKVVIRQFGAHFEIDRTLKLLRFAVTEPEQIKASTTSDSLISHLPYMHYSLESVPQTKIDSIISVHSKDVEKILEQKVYRENTPLENQSGNYSYFSKNNKYHVFTHIQDKEVTLDILDQIYSFNVSNGNDNYLFVFVMTNRFRHYKQNWLSQEFEKSQMHNLPINEFEYFNSVAVDWLGDDIFIITYKKSFGLSRSRFIYLQDEDVVIKDFDSYLNSHRKNLK